MRNEWKINDVLRVKRFEAAVMEKKVVSLEAMIRDLKGMAAALSHQIDAEQQRTKVKDARRADYSMAALAAVARRTKLMVSLADLRSALEAAKREHATAEEEVRS